MLTCLRTSRVRAHEGICRLYLHSPALEGMWMGALQEHTGEGVPAPHIRTAFPSTPLIAKQRREL
jgi:hypothetical protein